MASAERSRIKIEGRIQPRARVPIGVTLPDTCATVLVQ